MNEGSVVRGDNVSIMLFSLDNEESGEIPLIKLESSLNVCSSQEENDQHSTNYSLRVIFFHSVFRTQKRLNGELGVLMVFTHVTATHA